MRIPAALPLIALVAFCACAVASPANALVPLCQWPQRSTTAEPCAYPAPTGRGGLDLGYGHFSFKLLSARRSVYQAVVTNTGNVGYAFINAFNLLPPDTLQITAVTSSEGGRCKLANGALACVAGTNGLVPPGCPDTPKCPGGKMSINFTATGYGSGYGDVPGWFGILQLIRFTLATPPPYMPSYIPQSKLDVPICGTDGTGKASTKAMPCANEVTGN